jgi:HAD superfamily phosphoserine phosphatase-like hydrolase
VAAMLRGVEVAEFAGLAQRIVDRDLWPDRLPPVVDELEAHRQAGRRVILCSGTFQPVLEAFAHRLDAEAHGTRLEEANGRLTGRLLEPPNTGPRKAARLAVAREGAMLRAAYGDSLADLAMLEQSREAIAVHPEGKLREVALARGWRIIEGT